MSDSGTSGPIFIIGGSRTGSELHRTILTHSPRIDLVEEMWLLCPSWLHTDFATHLERAVGALTEQGAIDRLMDLMYSKKPFGYFWSVIDRDLAPEALRAALLQSEPTLRGVFDAILTVHAQAKGRPIRGLAIKINGLRVALYRFTTKHQRPKPIGDRIPAPRHQVPVDVHRDVYRGVPHEWLDFGCSPLAINKLAEVCRRS
jgi:hypothetical protein